MPPTLEELGWDDGFAAALAALNAPDLIPGRIVEHRGIHRVATAAGELSAVPSGKLRHRAGSEADLPAVGDWVALRPPAGEGLAAIDHVLPRRSALSRKVAGERTDEQVLAANVDVAFLVMGLDGDFNPRRLERYLTMVWEGQARPVVLLTKADLVDDVDERLREIEPIAAGAPVHAVNLLDEASRDVVAPHLGAGRTAVLLGSSGVGKSTLINQLLSREAQRTGEVRSHDSRGRHTTTHRHLFRVPGGALVIDTPGMRELQLWRADEALGATFADVDTLAAGCRFRDCRHEEEPGCAVRAALEAGSLDPERWDSYQRLRGEVAAREDGEGARRRRQHARVMSKALSKRLKEKE